MGTLGSWAVVGLDNGGTSNNATVLDASGRFLIDRLVETPSSVQEGPDVAVEALMQALDRPPVGAPFPYRRRRALCVPLRALLVPFVGVVAARARSSKAAASWACRSTITCR